MDADRFDTLARSLSVPRSRRAALSGAAAGGFLSALGLTRSVPEARAAQGGTCVVAFAAQLLQGPSTQQALTPGGGRAGEVRGELSFSLLTSGKLDNAALTLADGTSLPVVGQAMGHSLQLRIALGPQRALVAVGVGEREISRCQGAIDGVATGPQRGDLGDWHAVGVQQARGGQGGADAATQGSAAGAASGAAGAGTEPAGRDARARGTGRGTTGSGSAGSGSAGPDSTGSGATAPSCPAGETYCAYVEECRNLRTSPLDCGACSTRCPSLVCQEGRCLSEEEADRAGATALNCGPGETFCTNEEGYCADLQTDPLNCGQCGLPCASELGAGTCIDGACACSPGTTRCDDACVNTDRDPLNCGECGNACTDGQECLDGACAAAQTACPEGQTPCGDDCVDLETDPDNCGECGNLCPVSPEIFNCEGGVCVPPSCDPLTNCGGLCVDLQTDSLHCGECGAACPAGEACVGGECTPGATTGCPEGQLLCGDACRNAIPVFGTNGLVCAGGGAPPTACPAGQVLCNGACYPEGACQPAADCPPGQGLCYGLCRDFLNDPGYCGGCSTGCTGGAICSGGACVTCAAGLTACYTACVDTKTDLNNCGFCGNLCGTQCINGQCLGVGPAPTTRCALVGESCVFNRDCCSGELCFYGNCYIAAEVCAYGSAKCPSTAGTFCADTENDPNFCGDCTTRCAAGDVCQDGDCYTPNSATSNDLPSQPIVAAEEPIAAPEESPVISCPEGQDDCGGVCTDVSFDPLNCGGCGVACGPGIACDFGVCGVEPAPPETAAEEPVVAEEEPVVAEEPIVAPEEPADCLAAGGACDPATPGVCCSGACNDDGTCA